MNFVKLFVILFSFAITASFISAEQISITSFNKEVFKTYIKNSVLSDFKDLKDPVIKTEVKTNTLFENISTDVHYVFIDFAKPQTFLGKVLIDIVFLSEDNKIIANHKCLVETTLTGKVYVATKRLNKNHIITEDDFDLVEKEMSSLIVKYITNKTQLIGKQTKKRMSKGIPFSDSWVEIVPIIKKGDPIFAIVKSPGYEIKCDGVALQAGNIGDMIQLKSSLSKKILRGEILNEKSILVSTN